MQALTDNTTGWPGDQMAGPTHRPASNLASSWARGRRRITPWAYPHLRALGATRLAIGLFLTVLGALLLAHGHDGWAAIPLAGAALHFSIGGLDMSAAGIASSRA
ncbi:MAG TPA: hypothetical protein VMA73_08010 [Streptosporangiaceae bacterium]|nr:hypothetical protein [Streptosporangiaceae bacterium]